MSEFAAALAVLTYPEIDPVLIQIGPIAIRWYALAYIAGLIGGWRWVAYLNRRAGMVVTPAQLDDLLFWIAIGVILGGRIGHVLFYGFTFYLHNPLEVLMVWRGGMSFHGGILGVIVAIIWYARKQGLAIYGVADLIAPGVPIGLFFGRLANFINGELYGRPSDVPWAIVLPKVKDELELPRHPSQLYEAALEGLVLLALLNFVALKWDSLKRPGELTGVFLVGYAIARSLGELFREPEKPDGYIGVLTIGQALSLPMLAFGLYLLWRSRRAKPA